MKTGSFNKILENAPIGFANLRQTVDESGKTVDIVIIEVNKIFAMLIEQSATEILNKSIVQILTTLSNSNTNWMSLFEDLPADGSDEIEINAGKLNKVFKLQFYRLEKNYFAAILTDITQERQMNEELENFFSVNPDLLCIADYEGNFVKTNAAWSDFLGYPTDELKQRRFFDFIHPEDVQPTIDVLSKLSDQETLLSFVNRYRKQDGTYRFIEWRSYPKGKRIYAAARDITDRRETENALRISLSKYKILIDSFPIGITVSDSQGQIIETNEIAAQLLGITREEQEKRKISDDEWKIISTSGTPMPVEEYASVRAFNENKLISNVEMGIVKSKDQITWLNVSAVPVPIEGYGVAIIYNDITHQKMADIELKESEEKHRVLFMNSPDSYLIIVDKTIVDCNHATEAMLRADRSQIIGKSPDSLSPEFQPDGKKSYESSIEKMDYALEKGYMTFEWMHRRFDGSDLYVEISIAKMQLTGKPALFITWRDITNRKQLENAQTFLLHSGHPGSGVDFFESLAQYLAVNLEMEYVCIDRLEGDGLKAQTVAIYNDGKFDTNVSYALKETPCGDVVGKTICCFPEDVCQLFPYDTALQDLKAVSYAGTTLWSFDGKPIGLIAVIGRKPLKNISLAETLLKLVAVRASAELERKQAQETLHRSNLYLENLINYANAPIIVWDPKFSITRFNHAFERISGYFESEVLGQSLEILFPPELASKSMDLIRKTLTGERWETVEIEILHRDTSIRTLLWNSATLFESDGETPLATIAQGQDITVRKKMENEIRQSENELRELNATKDKFFSIIAHDLRSPFNAFLGFTELMVEELHTMSIGEIQTIAENMKRSAINLFNLLENLLEWSRVQRGMVYFAPETIKLRELITDTLLTFSDLAMKKEISIRFNVPESQLVYTDHYMLQTVIRNLIANAIKFTNRKGEVIITSKSADNEKIELTVSDNGIGMSEQLLDNLFKIDKKSNRKGTEDEPSTGLGLLLCDDFASKMGSEIKVKSIENEGSSFSFVIPVHNHTIVQEKPVDLEIEIVPKPQHNYKILIAEDDEANFTYAKISMSKTNNKIIHASNGEEAIEICRSTKDIDMILMDLKMPVLDGFTATTEIRKFNKNVPIIALTAFAQLYDRVKAIKSGCTDYLSKPVKKDDLLKLIDTYLSKKPDRQN